MDNSNGYLKLRIGAWEDGFRNIDDFVKSPHAVLRCILRRCSVRKVRFTP